MSLQLEALLFEHFLLEPRLPSILILCSIPALACYYIVRHQHRRSPRRESLPDFLMYGGGGSRGKRALPWTKSDASCQLSPCARFAVITRPMLLATMESGSKAVSTTNPRRTKMGALTGMSDTERMAEVYEEAIVPIMGRALSLSGIASSGLAATFDRCLASSLRKGMASADGGSTCRLSEFVGRHIFEAVSESLFGPTFPIDSYADLSCIASNIQHLQSSTSKWPFSTNKAGHAAQQRMMNAMISYIEEWWYADGLEHIPGISPLAERFLRAAKEEELTLDEAAGVLLAFLWDAVANLWSTTFWLMMHILSNSTTYRAITQEIRSPASYCSSTPFLDSSIQETLRWAPATHVTRQVDEDAVFDVDGKPFALRAGTQVVADFSGMHFDEDLYPNCHKFNAKRFLDESLPLPRAFGEGKHMCKGLHLAKLQIKSFVIHALKQFDIELMRKRTDGMEGERACSDVSGSVGGSPCDEEDVTIRTRIRDCSQLPP